VTAQIGCGPWYHHQVAEAWRDLLLAPRAHVALASLERMHPADLHVSRQARFGTHGPIVVDCAAGAVSVRSTGPREA